MARICFLFNHDQLHQISHSLPIALELAAIGSNEVVLAAGSKAQESRLRELVSPAEARVSIVRLDLHRLDSRMAKVALQAVIPARKILVYRDNLDFFRSFDALVVTEKTSLLLKTRYGLDGLKIIHTRHGAGDRAIGFEKEGALFDLHLVAGPKIARRLEKEVGVDPSAIRITGYPKFVLYGENRIENPFPDKTRPIVLYAPHPSPGLSSYYKMGRRLLEAFARSDRYNLIFAPHVMLFQRQHIITISPPAIRHVPQIDRAIEACPNIIVDRGSLAATDMSYTNLADLYCGDASSQVYEFLKHPRPVLHLDAHNVHWRDDPSFAHWHAGPVAGVDADIIAEVDHAFATHGEYVDIQRAMFADTFSETEVPASRRAARAISEFLS